MPCKSYTVDFVRKTTMASIMPTGWSGWYRTPPWWCGLVESRNTRETLQVDLRTRWDALVRLKQPIRLSPAISQGNPKTLKTRTPVCVFSVRVATKTPEALVFSYQFGSFWRKLPTENLNLFQPQTSDCQLVSSQPDPDHRHGN